ncbi:MAG: hypothetical protein PHC28_17000 [Flavobacterium sp.]|nr:hypothetical protein [Flavobacterium sp.]MDD5152148.1 hypothetical protein [Flavobacterium sp.]
MKRILILVDFSEYSEEALKVAAQITRKNGSILKHSCFSHKKRDERA